ncbi:uncharacterized protein MEPE_00471 [Melanopsichium pennsylvanicum]|uniref:PHD-type domain-containing protein n=2 Tax=Melanopsichium pennsylvanicum TaxID=63383 RepID=A0AAJ5C2P7_9BASI|nr:uncharacterized phd zn-finger protein [Melanopsichium pennsylvanicum 4]SNX81766.1 uncharacterized protein MEPE_00471 [Melanopsichium pennsylvanicum]
MSGGEERPIRTGPDAGEGMASSAVPMDIDLPPNKWSAQVASGRDSIEPSSMDAADLRSDNSETAVVSSMLLPVKLEDEAESITFKSDSTIGEPAASLAALVPIPPQGSEPSPPLPAPTTKKKKSFSNTTAKKEASSSSNKAKKSSSSAKKASSSASPMAHAESSFSSRTKVKAELSTPPPTTTLTLPKEDGEEEDNALYCVCQKRQDDVEGGMIMCDRCEQWYHYRCMGITEGDAELVDQFICPPCHTETGEVTSYKEACRRQGCRRAAVGAGFSKFCSERCGVLSVTEKMKAIGVEKDKVAVEKFVGDGRVQVARKTEGFTVRGEGYFGPDWKRIQEAMRSDAEWGLDLGIKGAFDMMLKEGAEVGSSKANGVVSGDFQATINVTSSTSIHSSPPSAKTVFSKVTASSSPDTSSALSLVALKEQLNLLSDRIQAVDVQKTTVNSRLDRLDLRSTLLHLVSDRVPALSPVGSTSTDTPDGAGEDEDMPDESAAKKSSKKKKGGSKSRSKGSSSDASSGPRCGYDQRLHWDQVAFDTWASSEPGRSILSYVTPLDGILDDTPDQDEQKVVCATAKRRCRRHVDWSNLCELSLDAEKGALNAESRSLTQLKLTLIEALGRVKEELEVVKRLRAEMEKRELTSLEERDREAALRFASEGTRRGAAV